MATNEAELRLTIKGPHAQVLEAHDRALALVALRRRDRRQSRPGNPPTLRRGRRSVLRLRDRQGVLRRVRGCRGALSGTKVRWLT